MGDGYIKRIHVDNQKLRRGDPDPITIQTSAGSIKVTEVYIHGPSTFIYRPEYPMAGGARLWVETTALVTFP